MNKLILVMRHEIYTTLRRPTFLIFTIGLPLLLAVIALVVSLLNPGAGSAALPSGEIAPATPIRQEREGYVDAGGLIRSLPADLPANRLTRYPTEAAAAAALAAGEITGYYLIPADYAATGQLTYALPDYSPFSDDAPTGDIQRVLLFNLLGGDAALAAQVRSPLALKATALPSTQPQQRDLTGMARLFSTLMIFIIYMVVLIPASALVMAVTDEKKNRVMEVLATSISPQQLIGGKIVALGLLGLLTTALWVGLMWGTVRFGRGPLAAPPGFELPGGLVLWALVYFLGGYAIYGSLMASLGALAPDLKDARSAMILIMSPMIVAYMLNMIIVDEPNTPLALAASLFPLTAPVSMIARMTVTPIPLWQAAAAAGLQFLAAIWIVRGAARLFRAQTLLAGQAVSARGFLRALAAG